MSYVPRMSYGELADKPVTILIVDDEKGPREALRMILKDRCSVLTAENEAEALSRLTESDVDVDIVALDIRLGGSDGIDVLKAIKRVAPDVEVFLITGYPSVETAVRAMRVGAYDYVLKPFDKNEVREVVQKGILRQEQSPLEKRMQGRPNRSKQALS